MVDQFERVEILLVEDNASDAELCIDALKGRNLANNLVWVKDGAEALDFVFGEGPYAGRSVADAPRVILLDLRLPKVDGIEVLRRVRGDSRTKTIPIVVLTSSTEDRDLVESYDLGANGLTSKPVEFDAFSDVAAQIGMYWLLINRAHP